MQLCITAYQQPALLLTLAKQQSYGVFVDCVKACLIFFLYVISISNIEI